MIKDIFYRGEQPNIIVVDTSIEIIPDGYYFYRTYNLFGEIGTGDFQRAIKITDNIICIDTDDELDDLSSFGFYKLNKTRWIRQNLIGGII